MDTHGDDFEDLLDDLDDIMVVRIANLMMVTT